MFFVKFVSCFFFLYLHTTVLTEGPCTYEQSLGEACIVSDEGSWAQLYQEFSGDWESVVFDFSAVHPHCLKVDIVFLSDLETEHVANFLQYPQMAI